MWDIAVNKFIFWLAEQNPNEVATIVKDYCTKSDNERKEFISHIMDTYNGENQFKIKH